jgi:hypothetical protein
MKGIGNFHHAKSLLGPCRIHSYHDSDCGRMEEEHTFRATATIFQRRCVDHTRFGHTVPLDRLTLLIS